MKIVSDKDEMIFRKDYNDKPIYSIRISKKDKDGSYVNGYINCNFKKGTDIQNQTKIRIKDAWLDFYKKDNNTVPTIFINEYELVGVPKPKESNPFEEFAKSNKNESTIGGYKSFTLDDIEIKDEDLPW